MWSGAAAKVLGLLQLRYCCIVLCTEEPVVWLKRFSLSIHRSSTSQHSVGCVTFLVVAVELASQFGFFML